jgi:hypothetical protein
MWGRGAYIWDIPMHENSALRKSTKSGDSYCKTYCSLKNVSDVEIYVQ